MFPFLGMCCGKKMSHTEYQEGKLKFLKWMRDDMETRLAGLNAAISSIEAQVSRAKTEETSVE
ncbi:hypothetical protein [Synechococcus sp. PCC 7336]|uniref:hypothetical protein n=1 Tax=Synechococcus sp. PCC 7336 TaxID=195250 RepID=UPI000477CCC3|nr:hypothetical protein [Synechococcus sp. PCC 7336]